MLHTQLLKVDTPVEPAAGTIAGAASGCSGAVPVLGVSAAR